MADAKVIPFDDDRSRGAGQRPQRRRSGPRRPGDGAKVREVKAVPGRLNADVPEGAAPGAEPLDAGAVGPVAANQPA